MGSIRKKILICATVVSMTIAFVAVKNTLFTEAENMQFKKGNLTVTVPKQLVIADVDTYLNIRFQPSVNSAVIGKLKKGDAVKKTDSVGDWTKIDVNGQEGYVYSKYLLSGNATKKYIKKNFKNYDISAIQVMDAFSPIYSDKKAAIDNTACYTMTGAMKKNAKVYFTKSTKKTIANEYDLVEETAVSVSGLRLRKQPNLDSDIKTVLAKGTIVKRISQTNHKWVKVQVGGKKGYVYGEYLSNILVKVNKSNIKEQLYKDDIVEVVNVEKNWITVKRDGVSCFVKRKTCDVKASNLETEEQTKVSGFMENNVTCLVNRVGKEVTLVDLTDGTKGYIQSSLIEANVVSSNIELDQAIIAKEKKKMEEAKAKVTLNTSNENVSQLRKELVDYALTFVGNPYVWGGTSLTKGADCSGFTQQIFKKYGVTLDRCSYQQAENGTEISFEQLRAGDLLFYFDKELQRIGHVAIYMGDGKIVHAKSKADGITTGSWNYRTPYKAVNVIGD
jgi:cell wall-associated NlpC family hydrolase/SH3-like domain-containing protein